MNKTIEAIKAGNKVSVNELFEVVNAYVLTTLSLRSADEDRGDIMSMTVNQFEPLHGDYLFSQKCTGFHDVMYLLKADDLDSVNAEYNQKADGLYITCKLKNGMELWLMIVNVANSEVEIETDGFHESDIYSIKDFLDDVIHQKNEYYCIMARITDVFGFDLKMRPIRTYVSTLDDSDWKLHISDDANTFEVPVVDDCINLFYVKETESSKEILVKPYGQPFMEIRLLFFMRKQ